MIVRRKLARAEKAKDVVRFVRLKERMVKRKIVSKKIG